MVVPPDNQAGEGQSAAVPTGDHEKRLIQLLDPEVLGEVTVELDALLGRGTLTLAQLAALQDGAVVELDLPLNGMVDLSLAGRIVARGELVAVGDNFGVRISEVFARKP